MVSGDFFISKGKYYSWFKEEWYEKETTTGKRISDEELNDFIEAMEKYMPSFCERLMNNNPELTQREIHVCLLSKMGYSSSMIGVLLSLTKQRVTNIRGTANQKLFGEKGAGSLNKNMQNL